MNKKEKKYSIKIYSPPGVAARKPDGLKPLNNGHNLE